MGLLDPARGPIDSRGLSAGQGVKKRGGGLLDPSQGPIDFRGAFCGARDEKEELIGPRAGLADASSKNTPYPQFLVR